MEIIPALGIGDLLIWKMFFHYENIRLAKITILTDIINTYRTHPIEYRNFINYLINKLFGNISIRVINGKFHHKQIQYPKFKGKIAQTQIYDLIKFNTSYSPPFSNYIIFHTKLRLTKKALQEFETNLHLLKAFVKGYRTDKTIVLLGEREIDNNLETQIHSIKSLYSVWLEFKNGNKVVDLTKPIIYNANDIEDFEKDCQLIHGADCNVALGCGGNFVLSTAMANLTIGWSPYSASFFVDNLSSEKIRMAPTIKELCNMIAQV